MNFRSKTYYLSGAFILVIALIVNLGVLPLLNQIDSQSRQLAHQKQLTDSFFKDWQDSANTEKDFQEIQDRIKNTNAILPADQAINFILMAESFARQTDNVQTITDNSAAAAKSPTLNFQIALQGDFPNLIKFLIHLENAPYYNNVKSLQVGRTAKTSGLVVENAIAPQIGGVNTLINLSVYQNATTAN